MQLPHVTRRWRLVDRLEDHLPRPLVRLVAWVRSDESLSTAASLAFFALVSLPPTALIGFWVAGLIAGDERITQLGDQLEAMAPEGLGARGMVAGLAEAGTAVGWTSVIAALWPATAYGAGLARAFDRLTPTGQRPMDGIRGRLLVIVLIAILPLLVLSALLVLAFMPQLLGEALPLRLLGLAAAAAMAITVLSGILALLYGLFSPAEVRLRAALAGGAFAAVAISLISLGYVLYLRLGANFEERYGSSAFAAVVLLGLWLYLANGALIAGYKAALHRAEAPVWQRRSGDAEPDG